MPPAAIVPATSSSGSAAWARGMLFGVEGPDASVIGGAALPVLVVALGSGALPARRAEASLHDQPDTWSDWGSRAEVLQYLKQLWHVLVHFGAAAGRTTDRPRE